MVVGVVVRVVVLGVGGVGGVGSSATGRVACVEASL